MASSSADAGPIPSKAPSVDVYDVKHPIPEASEDVAVAYAGQLDGENTWTKKEQRRLRWKIDLVLIPIFWFNVTLGAIDKVTTATGAVYDMLEDCDLTGNRYSWVGSVFYRLPIAKTMCVASILWGFVLIGTGFANNFPTLIALRLLLGFLEAPIVPGNLIVLSMWYTRKEAPLRTGLMYTGLSVLIKGPLGFAIGTIPGALTIAFGFVIGIFLPDSPVKARFITEREKMIHVERMRADQLGIENKTFKPSQMWETFRDSKTWLMFMFNIFISIPNGGLTNFSPLIVKGMGWSSQQAVLLTMPSGIVQTLSSYICNGGVFLCAMYLPGKHVRTAFIVFGIMVGMIASVFLYTLPLDAYNSRLGAMFVSYFYLGPYIVSLGLISANTAGHTKKVVTNALIFMAYCVSNIIGPQFFKSNQAPLYVLGMASILGSYVLSLISILLYSSYCFVENEKRDRVDAARGETVHQDTDFKDLTDLENIHFRCEYEGAVLK
ncbi:related to DAL5-Allantoate and ureidosuccinate permease [Phialocephala subalpina]|uniref:Related to DAL5-Allantoate and ureidosuccinate permease n=1 Tax=Phialocephala subalpina TaxID=576137 RepID=A0A1L7WV00_9HELO|nr:related to DAL5-Allantoate and ureidosuccinate permease [Phialocephala subalpina]